MFAQCSPDTTPPAANCVPFGFVSLNEHGPNTTRYQAATLNNASSDNSAYQESYYISGPIAAPTEVERRFFVTDAANNEATVQAQYITISDGFTVYLPGRGRP